jgi:hypothetical protein
MANDDLRQLDEQCARLLGLEIVHRAWPCGYAPDCGTYEAALYKRRQSGLSSIVPDVVYQYIKPYYKWKNQLGLWCKPVPAYSSDPALIPQLLAEVERRELQRLYIELLVPRQSDVPESVRIWQTLTTTPAQHARAFVATLGASHADDANR